MSSAEDEAPSRYAALAARFFDGVLTDDEDQELAGLLERDPALASDFSEQARMVRLLAGAAGKLRVADDTFLASVRRGVELTANAGDNRQFAQRVIQLVNGRVSRRRARRLTQQRGRSRLTWIVQGVCAAGIILGVLFWHRHANAPSTPPQNNADAAVTLVDLTPNRKPEAPQTPPVIAPAPEPPASRAPKELADQPPPMRTPEEPALPIEQQAEVRTAPRGAPAVTVGKILALNGMLAVLQRGGAANATPAAPGQALLEGDTVRLLTPDTSPSEQPMPRRGELELADGSRLSLAVEAALRFEIQNGSVVPVLLNGEVTAYVKPQPPGRPLQLRTAQGPQVEVIGTVFRVAAEPALHRVLLRVEQGKVLLRNQEVERKVSADEACEAEDAKAPGAPYQYRPHAASLAGVVTDKGTGKPIAGAQVQVIPVARRKDEPEWPSVKTDAQGRFKFDSVPEGAVFVTAETTDGGKGSGLLGRLSSVRARLNAGENPNIELPVDRAVLVMGKVIDGSGKLLSGYRVRFIGPGGDGQTLAPAIQNVAIPDTEFRAVVTEGAGKYTPVVEKPGALLKLRPPKAAQLTADQPNLWMAEVQALPSASIKGRVVARGGKALTDDPGARIGDPHTPRSLLTLTLPNGQVQSLLAEADGSFLFNTNLDAGNYELKVERFGYAPAASRFAVTAGQALEFDVPLEPARR